MPIDLIFGVLEILATVVFWKDTRYLHAFQDKLHKRPLEYPDSLHPFIEMFGFIMLFTAVIRIALLVRGKMGIDWIQYPIGSVISVILWALAALSFLACLLWRFFIRPYLRRRRTQVSRSLSPLR